MSFIAAIVMLQIGSEGVCKDEHQTSQWEMGFSLTSSLSSGLCTCQRKDPVLLFLGSRCFVL